MVQTDGHLVRKPTVYFPADGTKLDLRLFRVDPRHLELVESPPEITPRLNEGANHADFTHGTSDGQSSAPEVGGNLSQSELDSFFE